MRKLIIFIYVLLLSAGSVKALDYKKNEISVSYGLGTINQTLNFEGLLVTTMMSYAEDASFSGAYNAEYIYRLNKLVGVGASVSYENAITKLTDNSKIKDNYITVMPAIKLNWISKTYFSMYTKAAIGATFGFSEYEGESKEATDFAFQASLIGIDVGKNICRFTELGFGQQGIIQFGVKVNF